MHIYPKRHVCSLHDINDEEQMHLADILRVVTKTYNSLFEKGPPIYYGFSSEAFN
ncbi:MAG: hypothetical protein ACP5K8_09005 [Nitrososphaeria archaeon]